MLRKEIPARTFVVQSTTTYEKYRKYLKKDFHNRCGYCDTRDKFMNFHIDHFAPKKIFPHLVLDYNNLVYSCPHCNLSKSRKWPMGASINPTHNGKKGFIDPCLSEYDDHLERNYNGCIEGKTELGNYIRKELKLYLKRHQSNWTFEKIEETLKYMDKNKLDQDTKCQAFYIELSKLYREINDEINTRN